MLVVPTWLAASNATSSSSQRRVGVAAEPLRFKSVAVIVVVGVHHGMMTGNKRDCRAGTAWLRGDFEVRANYDDTGRLIGETEKSAVIYTRKRCTRNGKKRQNKKSRYKYIYIYMERGSLLAKGAMLFYCFVRRSIKKIVWNKTRCFRLYSIAGGQLSANAASITRTHLDYTFIFAGHAIRARAQTRSKKKTPKVRRLFVFSKANGMFWSGRGEDRQSIKTGSVPLNRDHSRTIDFPLSVRPADVSVLRFFPNQNLPNAIKMYFLRKYPLNYPPSPRLLDDQTITNFRAHLFWYSDIILYDVRNVLRIFTSDKLNSVINNRNVTK